MKRRTNAELAIAVLIAVITAAYANHFHNSFHFDDAHTVVNNAAIRELRNVPLFFRDATTFSALPSNQSYRPLVSTLLAIGYKLGGGLDPYWFHMSIFALFVVLVLILAFVVHRVARNRYAVIDEPLDRTVLLRRGTGCIRRTPTPSTTSSHCLR